MAAAAGLADPRFDAALAQLLFERAGVVAAIGPQLGRLDATLGERVHERQQVPALVLVTGRDPHLERQPASRDG